MSGGTIFMCIGAFALREPIVHYIGTGWLPLNLAMIAALVFFAMGAGTEAAIRYCLQAAKSGEAAKATKGTGI